MRSTTTMLALLAIALGGCTLLNRPDRGRLDGGGGNDAGVDAPDGFIDGDDADIDGGTDANTDAWVCPPASETCGNRTDDDCDQLIDCADPDCVRARAPECCSPGAVTITDELDSLADWRPNAGAYPALVSGALADFGSGAIVGIVRQDEDAQPACLEPELGASVSFELRASACVGTGCDGFVQVVFGPSSEFRAGSTLQDDLGIRATSEETGGLRIDITSGGTIVESRTGLGVGPAGMQRVTVELALGVVDGVSAIVANVTLNSMPFVDNLFVVARDDVRTDLCPGLFLGIQGRGNDVSVDTVATTQLDCSNPSRVDPYPGVPQLTATTFSAAWANGGIGSPAILGRATAPRFMLLFDGSSSDRGSIGLARLPLSIGGGDLMSAATITASCTDWLPRAAGGGSCPTSAPMITEPAPLRVMQDPAMVSDGTNVRVVWAGEKSDTDRDLALYTGLLDSSAARDTTIAVSAPLDIVGEDCQSLRSPQIVPLVGSDPAEWLVFYVCNDMHPPVVHAARGQLTGLTRVPDYALGPAQFGDLARDGIGDFAVVVFNYTGHPTYRAWFLTRGAEGTVLSFAEGVATGPGAIPTFVPYAGNPVLRADEPDLGPCVGRCELHGVAATRIPTDHTLVQLMIERWDTGSASSQYALVPLEQSWPPDP